MAQVTATVKDPNGNLYTNAKVEAIFIPFSGATQLSLASGSVFPTFTVNTTDSFGVVSMSVTGNDLITPAGSQWRFSVISSTTPTVGFSVSITISGSTQDISAALQAAAAPLPLSTFGSIVATGLTVNGNASITGTLGVTGALTAGSVGGTVYCSTTLNAAVAAAPNPGAVMIPLGSACPVTSNLTVPVGIDLIFQSGSSVNIATATTLTINGTITANLYDNIFSFTGTGSVVLGKLAATRAGVMWWGAKCDSSTNDHTAIQSALTALIRGGTLIFPSAGGQCLDASNGTIALNINNTVFLTLMGDSESGMGPTASGTKAALTFTGAPSVSGISAQNAIGLTIKNMSISYASAGFTSTLVDATNATSFRAENTEFTGASVSGATNLILLAGAGVANFAQFHNCTFGEAVNGINAGNYLILSVDHCDFGTSGDVLTGTYILGAGAGSAITYNKFELINAPNTTTVWDTSAVGCQGCIFQGNWIGDMPAGYTGTILKGSVGSVIANNFQGVSGATLLQDNGTQDQLVFIGNRLQSAWGTVFSCNGPLTDVDIAGNQLKFATITTFNGGAGPCFTAGATTGRVVDQFGVATLFGYVGYPTMVQRLTSNFITANNTNLQTFMSFSLPAGRNYRLTCDLYYSQQTANVADAFGLQAATFAPTRITGGGRVTTNTGATSVFTDGVAVGLTTTTATGFVTFTPVAAVGTAMNATLTAGIELPANASNEVFNVMVSTSNGADTVTILQDSTCEIKATS